MARSRRPRSGRRCARATRRMIPPPACCTRSGRCPSEGRSECGDDVRGYPVNTHLRDKDDLSELCHRSRISPGTRSVRARPPGCIQASSRRNFACFHCFAPAQVVRAPCRRVIPEVLVHLGYLRGLIYSSDKQTPKQSRTYIHFMETPARLACNPARNPALHHRRTLPDHARGIEG